MIERALRRQLVLGAGALCLACAWVAVRHGMGSSHSSAAKADATAGDAQAAAAPGGAGAAPPEKVGAGLMLTCGGEVLLLRRAGNHNAGTWGLPGGNADATDADLLHTAMREAEEEMGPGVPPFQVEVEVLTRRGKRLQKHYTVFVARMKPQDKAAWAPQLNEEHSDWRWFSLMELQAGNALLHPVVALALQTAPHRENVLAAIREGSKEGGGKEEGGEAKP